MRGPNWWKTTFAVALLYAATAICSPAQIFRTLVNFNETDGYEPEAPLVQSTDGNLYGTTYQGGGRIACPDGCGTVFKVTPTGTLTTLYRFCAQRNCTDGFSPLAGLVLGTDENFYGTTYNGGAYGWGTVFKISRGGTLTTLHSFAGYPTDGALPSAPLVQATDGNFYGTTDEGGTSAVCTSGCGTVFKITPEGTLTILQSFDGTNGGFPAAALIQATDGSFYGTTVGGGAAFCFQGCGTVFKMTSSGGTLTTLHRFDGNDGARPIGALVQASNGNFYGTTFEGALDSNLCSTDGNSSCGTVFKMTPGGTLTTLHRFDGTDGGNARGALIQAADGNFYGTTYLGGANGDGTVFKITSGGMLTTLHSFDGVDGYLVAGGLVQATNGSFYGATFGGGTDGSCLGGCGTIFSEFVGLGPFVTTLPTPRKVGQSVVILGTNLTGATSVTFNGTVAAFTVESRSAIRTTVPEGATSGTVQVVTPGRTLSSNVPFRVLP